ncbi:MAG: hypothetical protein NT007_06505 [Candidatus Kapabacteria bacterium]|nr:hypothetical protein [Candidatus Kapabacteria bacterium]
MKHTYSVIFLLITIITLSTINSLSQESAPKPSFFQISGSVSMNADFYSFSASPDSAQKGRRPPSLYRLMFSPTLKFGDYLSIPFNFILSSPEANPTSMALVAPTLMQYLQNPANALSFAPKIGWAEFFVGNQSPNYSQLSAGDQQLLGLGFNLKPGNFQLAASAGSNQRAIETDTAKNIHGSYRRDIYMARVAFGSEKSSFIGFNVIRAKDAANSIKSNITGITAEHSALIDSSTVIIPADTTRLRAEEGYVASVDGKFTIIEGVSINGEVSLSSFTRDLSSAEMQISGNPLNSIQTTRTSTRADFAGSAAIKILQKTYGISLSGLYIGAGFKPVGFTFMQSDRIELKAAPYLRLFNNKFSLSGSIGERINNISKTKTETSTQMIGSVNMNADIIDELNISAQYSNFGIRNNIALDTLRVQNVSQALSIDPTVTLHKFNMTHIITAGFAIDEFKDYNLVSGAESSNNTRTLLASYSIMPDSIPLSVNFLASYMENRLSTGTLYIRSIGSTFGYSFFERKLIPTFNLTASGSSNRASGTDAQLLYKFSLQFRPMKTLELRASIGNNNYSYGNPLLYGSTFKETLVQLAVMTQF